MNTSARIRRLGAVLLAATGLAAGAAAFPASAAPPPLYVGLGDSFAAGVGGDTIADASCGRTAEAYSTVLGGVTRACGGATTEDVIQQAATLRPATRTVTVTVGGNDVGALQTTAACLEGSVHCAQMIEASQHAAATLLPGRLSRVVAAVRAAAPRAEITLTGYPRLFDEENLSGDLQTVAQALNVGADVLNSSIRSAAEANSAGFVSVTEAFDGHGFASADPWIRAPSEAGVALHPTSAGHRLGYAPAVGAALGPPLTTPAFAR
ncbi:SGNH/GDSL hydrolase family protein [Sinomonas mesophila]|uniref:SGNH/GDSL hydrolase family protein n=1 Tax=Sinomonas mesophila TaxID=1531955 RepID=UPI00098745CC|nr:SGNH/GDSL hydrolase family protein [Sinomonas mesophila]